MSYGLADVKPIADGRDIVTRQEAAELALEQAEKTLRRLVRDEGKSLEADAAILEAEGVLRDARNALKDVVDSAALRRTIKHDAAREDARAESAAREKKARDAEDAVLATAPTVILTYTGVTIRIALNGKGTMAQQQRIAAIGNAIRLINLRMGEDLRRARSSALGEGVEPVNHAMWIAMLRDELRIAVRAGGCEITEAT